MKRDFLVGWCAALAVACGGSEGAPIAPAAGGSAGASGAGGVESGGASGSGAAANSSGSGGALPAAGSGGVGGPGGVAGASRGGVAGLGGASAGGAGMGGASGAAPLRPEGVPSDYTQQLDLSFAAPEMLSESVLAGNPSGWKIENGSLSFGGTGYSAPSPVNESLSSFAIIKTTKLGSFVLEVEMQQTNPDGAQPHRDLCIVFNAADDRHFYYAHIAATHDERSHNVHVIDGAPRKPITVTNSGGIQWGAVGTWHSFRLVRDVTSGHIAVYADGNLEQPILTASDQTFTSGYVGFGTFQDSGKVRNLKVWAKSAERVGASGFFSN